ncbi:DUF305 domain-containing protein [Couchioplanes caeruleus]|uniref:DUF305 domain-containing protein n=2 Tax=Couchioplanes caeruleus TaxID=56438 RepID=A0A1K0FA28_9ACTN|nr:DUF305 domain-containing protein [Couchioplanes caeruleus]OJF09695.1 DUF305 domain-containing protein [Couchioplanes caeruleus subsp. caeruleus]ROP30482.1 uncharacterized protein (DUF305 family) [Couchioplanes caeruleus]
MNRQRTLMLIGVAVVVLGAGGVALATRSGKDISAAVPRAGVSSGPPERVILPGRPGDPAVVTDSDKVRAPDGSTYNSIDTTFVQMMIVHHGQAIEMAKLAPVRAGDAHLRALADRISAAQGPEVAWFQGWLRDRRLPPSNPAHDHRAMPGMQSDAAMAALAGLTGTAFDREFVRMMSDHHQGAIQMAGDVLGGGADPVLRELANEMAVEQGSEIRRMRQLSAA